MKPIILASNSKYRKDLLSKLAMDFSCIGADIDEDSYKKKSLPAHELATILAYEKAKFIHSKNPDSIVIGSDQVLSFEGNIFGKSGNFDNALKQLKQFTGKTHQLITSVCLLSTDQKIEFTQTVNLTMRNLSDKQLTNYLRKDKPYDCAGSYKIEETGVSLFEKIECDDYTGIIGLPMIRLCTELQKLSYEIF